MTKNRQKIVGTILTLLIIFNYLFFKNLIIGAFFGTLYLLFFSYILGSKLFSKESGLFKLFWGGFLLDSLFIFIGAITYFINNLAFPRPLVIISIIPLLLLLYKPQDISFNFNIAKPNAKAIFLTFVYALLSFLLINKLFDSATLEAVRGPWNIISPSYLMVYALSTLIWLLILYLSRSTFLSIITSIVHFFITSGVALIIFPLGYGFDSFLHRSTELSILTDGVIYPKTLYYIGQYSLLIHQHYLTLIPLELLDKLLLPIGFSLFVPALLYLTLNKFFSKRTSLFAIPILLLIPVSSFIQTTPQGLSNIYVLVSIIWFLYMKAHHTPVTISVQIFLAIVTFVIHPLSGIALFLWLGILISHNLLKNSKIIFFSSRRKLIWGLSVLSSTILFPVVFLISSLLGSPLTSTIKKPNILDIGFINIFSIETFNFSQQFNIIYDFIYLYRFNWILLILILGFTGIFLNKRTKKIPNEFIIGFAVLFLNSVFVKLFINFDNLIFYERTDFSSRLFGIALLFLLPYVAVTLKKFYKLIKNSSYSLAISLILITSALTASMYVSYPRYDSYELIRTFNTSKHDIEAVRYIEKDTGGADYVVLANQAVAAAAVQEFGFKKYYNNRFFYPLPTGGELYQNFLAIVEGGASALGEAEKVHTLTGVQNVYVVLNDYWFNSELTETRLRAENENIFVIGDGKVTIFKYIFK